MHQPIQVFWKTRSEESAENFANLVLFPVIIISCMAFIYAINEFIPIILKNDLGILPFVIVPLAICIVAWLLFVLVAAALAIETISMRIGYSVLITFLMSPFITETGVFGNSKYSFIATCIIILIMSLITFKIIITKKSLTMIFRWILGTALSISAIAILINLSIHLGFSAGWLLEDATPITNIL